MDLLRRLLAAVTLATTLDLALSNAAGFLLEEIRRQTPLRLDEETLRRLRSLAYVD